MDDAKKWWASRGIWGSLVAGVSGGLSFYAGVKGYIADHPQDTVTLARSAQAIWDNAASAAVVIGAFVSWIGRWKATKTIDNKML